MGQSELRNWLLAYDIADPRRLRRVHACVKKYAIPVQLSVFVLRCNERTLENILAELEEHIDIKEDDVRAYHVPHHCEIFGLGRKPLPRGVLLPAEGLSRMVGELTSCEEEDTVIMIDAEDIER